VAGDRRTDGRTDGRSRTEAGKVSEGGALGFGMWERFVDRLHGRG